MTTPDQKPPRLKNALIDALFIAVALIVVGAWVIGFDHTL